MKSEGILTKRRLGIAGLAAFAACAACCSVPLLVAAGVGGGTLAAVASILRPGAELIVGGGVALAVVGVAAIRARNRTSNSACGDSCAVDPEHVGPAQSSSTCGCGPSLGRDRALYESPKVNSGEPIVCTAALADKPRV